MIMTRNLGDKDEKFIESFQWRHEIISKIWQVTQDDSLISKAIAILRGPVKETKREREIEFFCWLSK